MILEQSAVHPSGPQLLYRCWDDIELPSFEWQFAKYENAVTLALVDYRDGTVVFYSCWKRESDPVEAD